MLPLPQRIYFRILNIEAASADCLRSYGARARLLRAEKRVDSLEPKQTRLHAASDMASDIATDNGSALSCLSVEASGLLKLTGRSEEHVLTPGVLERSQVLTNIVEAASDGDKVTLPITRAMVDAWLAAIATGLKFWPLWHLGSSALQLTQTLVVRYATHV